MENQLPVILVVDDIEMNRAILAEVFAGQYAVLEAENGRRALEVIEQNPGRLCAILLDNIMPEMDGLEMLREMNRRGWSGRVPVIMISSEDAEEAVLRGYELGVADYVNRPFSASIVQRRVANLVDLFMHKRNLEELVNSQTRRLKESNLFLVDTLSTVVEFRNGESGLHTRRIRAVTELLLRQLARQYPEYRLTEEGIEEISNAAALHDIGKIAVPEQILNKPGKLTAAEFEVMKIHTIKGGEILRDIGHFQEESYIRHCFDICRHHHERWDGGGYPDGLRGTKIPLCAQVVSLADVYDALTSVRAYKPAYSHKKAIRMVLAGECGVFNPRLIACLTDCEDGMEQELDGLMHSGAQPPPAFQIQV